MITEQKLPAAIDALLEKGYTYDKTLNEAMKVVGETLDVDRCFIYVRQPDQERGRIAFCWRKDGQIDKVFQPEWQPDTTDLPQEDPLFRSALDSTKVVCVDDVKTAGPGVLNEAFEHKTFGHRALIHAPIHGGGKLWGIMEPCVFEQIRHWTNDEKAQIEAILPKLQPVIADFVAL